MYEYNVLLIGAGRRLSLIERFLHHKCNVICYESDLQCPVSQTCTVIKGEPFESDDFINDIRNVIKTNNIQLVLSLSDKATFILSQYNIPQFVGSNAYTSNICYDKYAFQEYMREHHSDIYPSCDSYSEVISKPRFGNGAKNIKTYKDYKSTPCKDNFICQRYIYGPNSMEFTIDCYFNKYNICIAAVPRSRLRIAGGEVIDSQITIIPELVMSVHNISKKLKFVGPVCFQYVQQDTTLQSSPYFIMEINARFGGGVILTLESGVDMIQMLIDEYILNKDIDTYVEPLNTSLVMKRVNREVFF